MKRNGINCTAYLSVILILHGALCYGVDRYVSPLGGNVPPFLNWTDAATNIQDAIDVASAGDVIWVTNGVYATGGKVMAGDLINRVAVDKPLIVQSVNGPNVTTIQGNGATNGTTAVRCAWLTNGAELHGFTIQGGATRTGGEQYTLRSGGGVWCASQSAVVASCIIQQNAADVYGGGTFSAGNSNCLFRENSANSGGGAAFGTLNNCHLTGNTASFGGGTYEANLNNCSVIRNLAGGGVYFYFPYSGQLRNCTVVENTGYRGVDGFYVSMQNCIIWNNRDLTGALGNYTPSVSVMTYCCTYPLPPGDGNISSDPQLLADKVHLASTSSCRGAGSSLYAFGNDIDGQSWTGAPSIGCDEWYSAPLIVAQPKPEPSPITGQARISFDVAGEQPFYSIWIKDGLPLEADSHYSDVHTASLGINNFGPTDTGTYQVVVSNSTSMATSEVVQVTVRCVDVAGTLPTPPYTNWLTAAATIQDAIEVAGTNDVVLVTNGVYASGGKVKAGGLTNRMALDKPILVTSVNGPSATILQGRWDPVTTNGPSSVRCAWLADGARLGGFTLQDGTTTGGFGGGGAWCASTNVILANCVITNCRSGSYGGGVVSGTLNQCMVVGNSAIGGGGAYNSLVINSLIAQNIARTYEGGGTHGGWLYNCAITENSARTWGGGVYFTDCLINCTVTKNSAGTSGGGINGGGAPAALTNCIFYFNSAPVRPNISSAGSVAYTCSTPLPSGLGNISVDPQMVDGVHLAVNSPCRGMGSSLYAIGADIDGEPWASPPSMGCDEVWESGLTGPLSVKLTAAYPEVAAFGAMPLTGEITGSAARLEWSFGDGPTYTNLSYVTSHTWTNPGDYTVTFTAFNTDHPGGVSTNLLVHVVPLVSPTLSVGGLSNTTFRLSFTGQPGVTYVVERATNLMPPVAWQTVQTLSSTGALMQVTDTQATNVMRFYRTRTL